MVFVEVGRHGIAHIRVAHAELADVPGEIEDPYSEISADDVAEIAGDAFGPDFGEARIQRIVDLVQEDRRWCVARKAGLAHVSVAEVLTDLVEPTHDRRE